MRDVIRMVSAASAGAVAVALLLACAADASTGRSILAGTVFASLAAAELKARINQARPAGAPGHDDGGGMPSSHATATSFAAVGWALVLQPDAPRVAGLLPLAALAVAALRVASQHHTPTQAAMGLILGFLLACSWVRFGARLALAGLFMHLGRARLWRQGVGLAERTALRVSGCLPLYLCGLYALLFALAGMAAAGFGTGAFRFDMYLSTFRIEGDRLADLPHRLLLAQQATWALPPLQCAGSPAWSASGFGGMAMPGGLGTLLEEEGEDAGAGRSTVGPPLLIFIHDIGGEGDVLTIEAIQRVSELLASLGPALSEDLPLFATRPLGAAGAGLLSPLALFTAPVGRVSRHISLECDADGCSTLPGALPGGAPFRLTAEEVKAVLGDPLAGAAPANGAEASLRSWLTAHCRPAGRGQVRCGPVSCCACDAPPAVGCLPLPLCREEEDQLVFADVWAQITSGAPGSVVSADSAASTAGAGSAAWPPSPVASPGVAARSTAGIGSDPGAENSDPAGLASFERAKAELLQCTGAAARLFQSLLAGVRPSNAPGSAPPTGTVSRSVASTGGEGGSAGGAVRAVVAVARLRYRCGADEAGLCDGAAYAAAIEPSGFFNYEALVQQARMHEEYMRLARTVTLSLEAFNREQASSRGSLRASAWGGPAFLGVDGERALIKMVMMIALSAATTAVVVGAAVGSLRLAVLALLAPVLAFPASWLLYAGLSGQRTLGLAQTGGLFVAVGIGVDDMFVLAAAARARYRSRGGSRVEVQARALRRSGLAITITSLTDAVAFGCNWATPIASVRDFGLFVGLLVLVNFALVVLTFPNLYILLAPPDAPQRPLLAQPLAKTDEPAVQPAGGDAGALPKSDTPHHQLEDAPPLPAAAPAAAPCGGFAHMWVPRLDRARPAVLLVTLLTAVAAAASLRSLRIDRHDYRWAAFQPQSNLHLVSDAFEQFAWQDSLDPEMSDAAQPIDHPVWPAREPLRAAWGHLGLDAPSDAPPPPVNATALQLEMERACAAAASLAEVSRTACPGAHFAAHRRALNLTYPLPSMPELSRALCAFGRLSFGAEAGGCAGGCADAECVAFRATAPRSPPPRGWHAHLRWRGADPPADGCGELALVIADFWLDGRPRDASGASLRPYYDAVADALRAKGGAAPVALVHAQLPQMRMEEMLLRSTAISAAAAFAAACGCVYAALRHVPVTTLVAVHVGLILLLSLSAMVCMGWDLGPAEAMMFTVSAGLSIDFVLHLAIAFLHAPIELRPYQRTFTAVDKLGSSVAQAAVTTAVAAAFMIPLPLRPLSRFGTYIIINQCIALAVAIGPFTASLLRLGDRMPTRCCGHRHYSRTPLVANDARDEQAAGVGSVLLTPQGEAEAAALPPRRMPTVRALATFPNHACFIMDGNGRWATRRGMSRSEGHVAGYRACLRLIDSWLELSDAADAFRGTPPPARYLTLYAFSTENWSRPRAEVEAILALLGRLEWDCGELFRRRRVRVRFLGNRSDVLSPQSAEFLRELDQGASGWFTINLCFSYGSRDEIVSAARSIARQVELHRLSSSEVDEATLSANLFTAGQPDPDLLIRTSGEQRISNFLLYQLAYTEMIFSTVLWPDFDRDEYIDCLEEYASRDRRLGNIASAGATAADAGHRSAAEATDLSTAGGSSGSAGRCAVPGGGSPAPRSPTANAAAAHRPVSGGTAPAATDRGGLSWA